MYIGITYDYINHLDFLKVESTGPMLNTAPAAGFESQIGRNSHTLRKLLTTLEAEPALPTLETTPRHIGVFFSQLLFKCYLPEVASVGDWLRICPWIASRVEGGTDQRHLSPGSHQTASARV